MAVTGTLYFLLSVISVCTGEGDVVFNETQWAIMSSFLTIMESWLLEIEANITQIKEQDVEGVINRASDIERRLNDSQTRFAILEGKMKALEAMVATRLTIAVNDTERRVREMLGDTSKELMREESEREQEIKNAISGCGPELDKSISSLKELIESDLEQQSLEIRNTLSDFKEDLLMNASDSMEASTNSVMDRMETAENSTLFETTEFVKSMTLELLETMLWVEMKAGEMVKSTKSVLMEKCDRLARESAESVIYLHDVDDESCRKHKHDETCEGLLRLGKTRSGVYTLHLNDGYGPLEVFCDMVTDGGGWVVFQRRIDGSEDFYRDWAAYEHGFGKTSSEFWLGNRNIHRLTRRGLTKLRVDMQAWNGERAFTRYSYFSVGDASTIYKLNVSGYSGTAGDTLHYNNGAGFSTWDRDHDRLQGVNCAKDYHRGAWWHKGCTHANLNGPYGQRQSSRFRTILWDTFRSSIGLKFTEMKLRATN